MCVRVCVWQWRTVQGEQSAGSQVKILISLRFAAPHSFIAPATSIVSCSCGDPAPARLSVPHNPYKSSLRVALRRKTNALGYFQRNTSPTPLRFTCSLTSSLSHDFPWFKFYLLRNMSITSRATFCVINSTKATYERAEFYQVKKTIFRYKNSMLSLTMANIQLSTQTTKSHAMDFLLLHRTQVCAYTFQWNFSKCELQATACEQDRKRVGAVLRLPEA